MKIFFRIVDIFILLILILIFKNNFFPTNLTSGDWHFFFQNSLNGFVPGIWGWDFSYNNGLGGSDIFLLGLNSYFLNGSYLFLKILNIPWWLTERIMWYWPFLIISIFSSYYMNKIFFKEGWIFSVIIFLTNTYTLLLIGGGQVGVAIAYSLSPLILGIYANVLKTSYRKSEYSELITKILIAGVVLGIQIFFDLRIAYITFGAVILLFFFNIKNISKKNIFSFLSSCIIAFMLNYFWIFPQSLMNENPIQQFGPIYSSEGAVKFFSFANFENAFGLLHPNWPQNIFGKVEFMKPEFLLLPILAYSSLFFIKKNEKNDEENQQNMYVLFFALLGLIGTFLAKGANDPFGFIYIWLFKHVPGFIMFRDPTKWYLLIVLAYSILIPYTISNIYKILKRRFS